jgi:N-acetylglucosamine-6-sulfatase
MRIVRVPLLLAVVLFGSAAGPMRSGALTIDPRPNIVLILTDDQRFDELSRMPIVQSELVGKGVSFDRGYVVNPLCCPSRTTILTGKYSHGTGIYGNDPPNGGFQTFHDMGEESSTIATWLQDAGYDTGLVGKYLNGYTPSEAGYVPPGWDTWDAQALDGENTDFYYNYSMSLDGQTASYGSDATDYSTDVLAGYADGFIRGAPAEQPLFLYFAPSAPHAPATPPPRYDSACPDVSFAHSASFNEEDVTDKPQYIASRAPLTSRQQQGMDRLYLNQCRALLAADDAVGTILSALSDTGRLSNTLIVFASDNGVLLGEHRWRFKKVPYEEASRIPLVARYDPLTAGVPSVDHKLVANLDFAPTFADAGSVDAPGAEGRSFLPLLSNPKAPWRARFLIEHMDTDTDAPVPTYCAVHTKRFLYVDYATGEEELYDLSTDPLELANLAGDPTWDATRRKLHRGVVQLCSPPPPGYTP